jgi:Type I phosphodiesterase / nucleotide pyrophosphatase
VATRYWQYPQRILARGGITVMRKRSLTLPACLLLMAALQVSLAYGKGLNGRKGIKQVLLISIDGFHALDYLNCSNGISTINGGQPYCPHLAALGTSGINYLQTSTSTPSDSFPGLTALVTGGSPRTTGVNYDVAYDRALNPPSFETGNGLLAGPCSPGTPSGTSTEYDEGININDPNVGMNSQMFLNGGAPSGDGGVNSIDPRRLERDQNCNPVYPWNFLRVNTIFGVIHNTGGYTAWADKHPSYSSVGGPSSGTTDTNVDDYFGPEINSDSADYTNPTTGAFPGLIPGKELVPPNGCNPLPDQAAVSAADDYTGSFQNIQCYDGIKVNAILNEIDGMNHDGTANTSVPNIFGMNFQAVSVGQKLIYQHGTLPSIYSENGGYTDSIGTPSPSLFQEIEFVDRSIGMMVSELQKQGLYKSTLIIITAKHGQSPVDSSRYIPNGSPNDPASILSSCIPDSELNQIGPTEDDVALLWLLSSCDVSKEVNELETASPAAPPGGTNTNIAGIGEIFSGPSIGLYYNPGDSRAPDILITPNIGVTYSNSGKKLAEHGGFAHDDVNVILLVSNPKFAGATITTPVETKQVAPTILTALGLDPSSLQAVVAERTQILPGLPIK